MFPVAFQASVEDHSGPIRSSSASLHKGCSALPCAWVDVSCCPVQRTRTVSGLRTGHFHPGSAPHSVPCNVPARDPDPVLPVDDVGESWEWAKAAAGRQWPAVIPGATSRPALEVDDADCGLAFLDQGRAYPSVLGATRVPADCRAPTPGLTQESALLLGWAHSTVRCLPGGVTPSQ